MLYNIDPWLLQHIFYTLSAFSGQYNFYNIRCFCCHPDKDKVRCKIKDPSIYNIDCDHKIVIESPPLWYLNESQPYMEILSTVSLGSLMINAFGGEARTHTQTHTCMHALTHTHAHTHIACTHSSTDTHAHACTPYHTHMLACTHARTHVWIWYIWQRKKKMLLQVR